ncbi:hypothetical protein DFH07DRAFT_990330 [Mycena maculata]|uniref:Myb/SANT-like domain-containing protein n=1 Tax=Mycena maculata TaxID=230809 RepID=A0AAD7JZG4_9AGAR|nr:hypothetical protein DFH07DRAFT_990330 [Mycena maculata]
MPDKTVADWTSHPEDLTHALQFLHEQRSRIGDGGNFDKTVFNEAAAYMAEKWPPKSGGAKTEKSIRTKWKAARKLHEQILQAKQKRYPGALGWTYTDEHGFNVTDSDRDAWNNFSKAHPHFKPFATCGWIHFQVVDEIIPSLAHGRHIFHGGATQPMDSAPVLLGQSQSQQEDEDEDEDEQSSQPFLDWSQSWSNFGNSQPSDLVVPMLPPQPSQSTIAPRAPAIIPSTPASVLKRNASSDDNSPWSNKRTRTTGPESILALGHSVEGIGKVMVTVFAPHKSSAMSPTKKLRPLAKWPLMTNGFLLPSERTRLNILFGRDTTAADAYIADDDALLRIATAHELLNPTPMY